MEDAVRTAASLPAIRPRFFRIPFPLSINLACYRISIMPNSLQEVYFSAIATFVNFAILKWQGTDKNPYDAHPKTMAAAVFSFLLLLCSIRAEAGGVRVVFFFWCCTMASLVSLLLPDCVRPILYVLCFVPLSFELLRSVCVTSWRKFREWLDYQRICFVRLLMIGYRRRIPRLPISDSEA